MPSWTQLGYIPILLLPLRSYIHYIIRGLSRDRFDESACINLSQSPRIPPAMGCRPLCHLFPVQTSARVICPICYKEIILHRKKSMETIVCLVLTQPELYCITDTTATIVLPCDKIISIFRTFSYSRVFDRPSYNVVSIKHNLFLLHAHKHILTYPSWHWKNASLRHDGFHLFSFWLYLILENCMPTGLLHTLLAQC